ncbi:MAG: glycosyltransferase family 2 protein [Burkholderiales bacterium]|nr:glycosyltransferase family 2 protein [Burkholderiales bacterium]
MNRPCTTPVAATPSGAALPLVSVMIPVFNQAAYVERAIRSALAQDYPNLEIVVSDDASSDGTPAVVERFILDNPRAPVVLVKSSVNRGILRNYHDTLYAHITGEWVINLDGDDFFLDPGFIRRAVLAAADERIVLALGNYCEYAQATGEQLDIRNSALAPVVDGNAFVTLFAKGGVVWNHNCILYRRAAALAIGFYWNEQGTRNDWESFLRLVINRRVAYVDSIAAAWVQHAHNETARLDQGKYMHNYTLIEGVCRFALDQGISGDLVDEWRYRLNLRETRSSLFAFLKQGSPADGIRFLRQAGTVDSRLPLRVAISPETWARALLGASPGLHAWAKKHVRSAA